jgi:hypothetical protein
MSGGSAKAPANDKTASETQKDECLLGKETIRIFDNDIMTLLARQLTREQAGIKLALLCKAGAEFVRAADKRESELVAANALGGRSIWREDRPMWNLQRTYERLRNRYAVDGEDPGSQERVLRSLAAEIVQLHIEKICELEFEAEMACDGKKMSLLGCHTLYVLDPVMFLVRLTDKWLTAEMQKEYSRLYMRAVFNHKPGAMILNLFEALGFKRPKGRKSRCEYDAKRFRGDRCVSKTEPLWHERYVAM